VADAVKEEHRKDLMDQLMSGEMNEEDFAEALVALDEEDDDESDKKEVVGETKALIVIRDDNDDLAIVGEQRTGKWKRMGVVDGL
jgi:hypothetical protein